MSRIINVFRQLFCCFPKREFKKPRKEKKGKRGLFSRLFSRKVDDEKLLKNVGIEEKIVSPTTRLDSLDNKEKNYNDGNEIALRDSKECNENEQEQASIETLDAIIMTLPSVTKTVAPSSTDEKHEKNTDLDRRMKRSRSDSCIEYARIQYPLDCIHNLPVDCTSNIVCNTSASPHAHLEHEGSPKSEPPRCSTWMFEQEVPSETMENPDIAGETTERQSELWKSKNLYADKPPDKPFSCETSLPEFTVADNHSPAGLEKDTIKKQECQSGLWKPKNLYADKPPDKPFSCEKSLPEFTVADNHSLSGFEKDTIKQQERQIAEEALRQSVVELFAADGLTSEEIDRDDVQAFLTAVTTMALDQVYHLMHKYPEDDDDDSIASDSDWLPETTSVSHE